MRRRPFLLGLLALLGSTLVAGAAVPAGAGPKPPEVPEAIQVLPPEKVVLSVLGKGVQIYDCNPTTLAWTFREPAASLNGRGGHVVGIHFRARPSSRSTAAASWRRSTPACRRRPPAGRSPGCG